MASHLPVFKGQVVVLHNVNVGVWPPYRGHQLKNGDVLDDRNLIGYVAPKPPLKVGFTLKV